jgi:glycerol-3-phosphate dehydrogenase
MLLIHLLDLSPLESSCITDKVKLIGAHGYSKSLFVKLVQTFGIETEVAKHLASSYGDRAFAVAFLAEPTGQRWPNFGTRISPMYPYITAEVRYACQKEYACTAVVIPQTLL